MSAEPIARGSALIVEIQKKCSSAATSSVADEKLWLKLRPLLSRGVSIDAPQHFR